MLRAAAVAAAVAALAGIGFNCWLLGTIGATGRPPIPIPAPDPDVVPRLLGDQALFLLRVLLAIVLLWRLPDRREALIGSLFLTLVPLSRALSANGPFYAEHLALLYPVGHVFSVYGDTAGLRFTQVFPHALTPGDLRGGPASAGPLRPARALLARLLDPRLVWTVLPLATIGLYVAAYYARLAVELATVPAINFVWAALIATYMYRNYRAGTPRERRKTLWLLEGVLVYLVVNVAVLSLNLTLGALGVSLDAYLQWKWVLVRVRDALALVCFAIAIFYSGTLDGALAIRKTTLYGALTVCVMLVFTGAQIALQHLLATSFMSRFAALHGSEGLLSAAASVLVATPARDRLRHGIDRVVDRLIPPEALAEGRRARAVVLFSDIVGYTALSATDQPSALTLAALFHKEARRAAERHKGRLVKTIGDAVLLEFDRPERALAGTYEMLDRFRAGYELLELPPRQLRTGIHVGEVIYGKDGDVFGDTVNVASRLQGAAEPGQVVVSRALAESLPEGTSYALAYLGDRKLKNVPEPVPLYAVSAAAAGLGDEMRRPAAGTSSSTTASVG